MFITSAARLFPPCYSPYVLQYKRVQKMILLQLFPFLLALCSHKRKNFSSGVSLSSILKEPFCKIQFHPSNKKYCCKDTNILIKAFSFQKSFQLIVSEYRFQQGNSAAFSLSCTRGSVQSWRQLPTVFSDNKREDFIYVEAKKLTCVLRQKSSSGDHS